MASLAMVFLASLANADNWPQWRGPDGNGISQEIDLPAEWAEEWRRELPGPGNSTPALWDDAVFVTCQEGERLLLLRIDKENGQVAWTRQVGVTGDQHKLHDKHRDSNMANPSPVTDGQVVVAHFGNGDLAAYDFSGEQLWIRNLQEDHGQYTTKFGHGNSPMLVGNLVISVCMQDARHRERPDRPSTSYLVAHDLLSGEQRWKTMRMPDLDGERCDSYTTPILRRVDDRLEVVVMGARILDAYDPNTGRRLWQLTGLTGHRLIPSPVAAHGMIYATTGYYEDEAILAVKVDGLGERSQDDIIWRYEEGIPDSPSPVVWGDQIYFINNGGIARCLDAHSGELLWKERLPGQYRASPMAADGRVYFLNMKGLVTVVSAARRFEPLAENHFSDTTLASPAISDGKLFIRGWKWLICLNDQER